MVILICGKPRSGKTTLSKIFNCPVAHLDNVQFRGCEQLVKNHIDERVCCEGYYPTAKMRKRLIDCATGKKICVWVNACLDIRKSRTGFSCDPYFEPPTLDEGWDKIVIIHDNDPKKVEVITNETQQQTL